MIVESLPNAHSLITKCTISVNKTGVFHWLCGHQHWLCSGPIRLLLTVFSKPIISDSRIFFGAVWALKNLQQPDFPTGHAQCWHRWTTEQVSLYFLSNLNDLYIRLPDRITFEDNYVFPCDWNTVRRNTQSMMTRDFSVHTELLIIRCYKIEHQQHSDFKNGVISY